MADKAPSQTRHILPSAEILHQRFSYDPDTGELRNKAAGFGVTAGKLRVYGVTILGKNYAVARVVWKMVTGDEPPWIVDHKDGDKSNNRWSNLRAADNADNSRNRVWYSDQNPTGHVGIRENKRKGKIVFSRPYLVVIQTGKKVRRMGTFPTLEKAIAARKAAEKQFYGEFNFRQGQRCG